MLQVTRQDVDSLQRLICHPFNLTGSPPTFASRLTTAAANGCTRKTTLTLYTLGSCTVVLRTGRPSTASVTSRFGPLRAQGFWTICNWCRLLNRHLAPGGYIEQLELSPVPRSDDGSIQPGDMWDECGKLAIECGERFGKTFQIMERMKNLIEQAGFVDVVETKYKWPLGAWSTDQKLKDMGRWNMHHWNEGLEGWTMALLTRVMGVSWYLGSDIIISLGLCWRCQWTYDEVKAWNAKMRLIMKDRRYHVYQSLYVLPSLLRMERLMENRSVVYARKPFPSSSQDKKILTSATS